MAFGLFRWPACRQLVSWAWVAFLMLNRQCIHRKSHIEAPLSGSKSGRWPDLVWKWIPSALMVLRHRSKVTTWSISSVGKIKWRARWGRKPIWGSILFVLADGLLWQPLKKEHLIWENSTEAGGFGFGRWDWSWMTSIGLSGWLPFGVNPRMILFIAWSRQRHA